MSSLSLASALAQGPPLSKDGIGPIYVSTHVEIKKGKALLTASAQNGSQWPITYAFLCVRAAGAKDSGCAFSLWINRLLQPGAAMEWNVAGIRQPGIETPVVTLEAIRRVIPQLQSVRRLYVGSLHGNSGEINRERIMDLLVSRGRFTVVEKEEDADATIRGRTDSEVATKVTTSQDSKRGAVVAGIGGVAAGAGKSSTNTSETTAPVVLSETVLLRLTLKSGETVWAWDDTKACPNWKKTECAVEDLISVAGN